MKAFNYLPSGLQSIKLNNLESVKKNIPIYFFFFCKHELCCFFFVSCQSPVTCFCGFVEVEQTKSLIELVQNLRQIRVKKIRILVIKDMTIIFLRTFEIDDRQRKLEPPVWLTATSHWSHCCHWQRVNDLIALIDNDVSVISLFKK